MPIVYLAGPINGCTDAEARGWRDAVASQLPAGWSVLDPMARDYRGVEAQNVQAIVEGDLLDIQTADAVLVNASRPSWGTAMELVYAHRMGKRIIAFGTARPSPWLLYHVSSVEESVEAAVQSLAETVP